MVGNFTLLLETMNATKYQLNPSDNTNKDAYISIYNDIKPKLEADFESALVVRPGEKLLIYQHVLFGLNHTLL